MGLMDKLKAMKNFVTGGGAKVSLEVDGTPALGGSFGVTVRAQVADAALKVSKVYVLIRGVERVEVRDDRMQHQNDSDGLHSAHNDEVRDTETLYRGEIELTGALELEANSEHEWSGEVTIPADCQPSYRGRNAWHTWQIQGALDVAGNDPDSGWVELQVR